ncbi:hypothetical protein [Dactylosporangium sp. NPDC051541]|uniref:hypothetical protein n=1 Tax=Dactylosporangium sp. NPDC051541 TaxID=3363977 RepID=UPI0037B6B53E
MKTWWLWLAVIVVTLAGAGFSAWFTARDADSLRVTDPSPELDAGEVDLSGRAKLMPLEDTQIRVKRRLKMADDAELRMQEKRPKPDPGPGTP